MRSRLNEALTLRNVFSPYKHPFVPVNNNLCSMYLKAKVVIKHLLRTFLLHSYLAILLLIFLLSIYEILSLKY